MMDARLAAMIDKAAEQAPMSNGEVQTVKGRLLLADGDGLCYYCAGNDDTAPGEARSKLVEKLRSAAAACGAEHVKIVTTSSGSHKGYRYAVARTKPYQGQRTNDRRPNNWRFLREFLIEGAPGTGFDVEHTAVAEADDLFSRYAVNHPDCVIYTQDKDMRMVPGWHLDWLTHLMFKVEADQWSIVHNEKVWGRHWFFQQMLHGDATDNIPGLEFYTDGSINKSGINKGKIKEIRCGEKSDAVVNLLPQCGSDMGACILLKGLYETCYGNRWLVNMLEQGILLWMRNDQVSSPLNVVAKGNPLHPLTTHEFYPAAKAEILQRIAEAVVHEEVEDDGSISDPGAASVAASIPVWPVSATVPAVGSGAGSLPHDGTGEGKPSPGVQQPVGQGGEQPQAVRGAQPFRVPTWGSRLLAKT